MHSYTVVMSDKFWSNQELGFRDFSLPGFLLQDSNRSPNLGAGSPNRGAGFQDGAVGSGIRLNLNPECVLSWVLESEHYEIFEVGLELGDF